MLFGKKRKNETHKPATIQEALAQETEPELEITEAEVSADQDAVVTGDDEAIEESSPEDATSDATSSEDSAENDATLVSPLPAGPRDLSDLQSKKGYLDFGAILLPPGKDQKVRLDIDQKTKRVVSLTIAVGSASIQMQAFSAPKSGGIWEDVRDQIEESVIKQKGRVKQLEGRFGKELHARVPTVLKDGRQGWRAARFIGFEGKRWFLRGVIGGRGAIDRKASQGVEDLFSQVIVARGDEPLPPRELLPLRPPAGAKRIVVPRRGTPGDAKAGSSQTNRVNGVHEHGQRTDSQQPGS